MKNFLGELTHPTMLERELVISTIWSHLFVRIIPFGMTQNVVETIILLQELAKQMLSLSAMKLNNPALKSIKMELTNLAIRHLKKCFIVLGPKLAFHILIHVMVQ